MRFVPTLLMAAGLSLAGCASPAPVQPTPVGATPVEPAAQGPGAPLQTPPPASAAQPDLSGRAILTSGAFANAAVTATLLGGSEAIATATTDADGRFGLVLPTSVQAGTLIKVSAVRDGQTLRAIVAAPAARRVQDDDELTLSDASTLALLLLGRRFDAAGQASRTPGGQPTGQVAADTLSTYRSLTTTCDQALNGQSDEVRNSVRSAGDTNALPPQLQGSTGLRTGFQAAAGSLDAIIRDGVSRGGNTPPADMLGQVSFGGTTASAVSLNGPSRGGSHGPRTTDVDGSVTVQDGQIVHEGAEGVQLVD